MDDRRQPEERRCAAGLARASATGRAAPRRPAPRVPGLAAALLGLVLASGCGGGGGGGRTSSTATTTTPASAPGLGSIDGEAVGRTVDGIPCQGQEQLVFHVHAHLAVFVGGRPARVPGGIGIAPPRSVAQEPGGPFVLGGACFYWLHSHTTDGIIHIESPIRRSFTLGNYFDLWNQPLGKNRVAAASGQVSAYLDGRAFTGDPRTIPLSPHATIQLDVGGNVPPVAYTFSGGL